MYQGIGTIATSASFSLALYSFTIRRGTLAGGEPNDSAAVNRQLVATRVMAGDESMLPATPSIVRKRRLPRQQTYAKVNIIQRRGDHSQPWHPTYVKPVSRYISSYDVTIR